jgi:hypothetical protein
MKLSRLYLIYGVAVLGTLAFAEYRGWSLTAVSESRDATPRSVRDNPGVSRPHYGGTGRHVGGK